MTDLADLLSPKQLRSLAGSTARVNIWYGSIRAGKTLASLIRFLIAVARADDVGEIVITGRNRDAIFRNVIRPLQDPALFGRTSHLVQYNRGAPTATILGRMVHVIGAHDAKAEASIRGMTVLVWYADEVTVQPEAFFTQMLGRMSPPEATMFGTTNPDNPRHWFKKRYLDRAEELGWRSWAFQLDDNPSLTEEYKSSVKAEFTGLWYRRFILGEWVAAEGAIYDMFDPSRHVMYGAPAGVEIIHTVCGVDYGTANAFAAVMVGLGGDGNLYVLDEWRHNSKEGEPRWTDAQLSTGLREFLDRQFGWPEWVAVDPSAASFHTQLFHDGVSRVMAADNAVIDGIRHVASLLSLDALKIEANCGGLLDELPGYVWDSKKQEAGADAPVKRDDHSLDALRYAVQAVLAYWGTSVNRLAVA